MNAEQLAAAIGVGPARLKPPSLPASRRRTLTEQDGQFSNTAEANQFLVKGEPSYIGNRHPAIAVRWRENFKTADSICSGVPKAAGFPQFSTRATGDIPAINPSTVRM